MIQQVRRIDFAKDIKPILESSCVSCHREGHDKGDLRLDEREYAFEAGEYGAAVVPFDLEKSTLYQSVTLPADHDDLMPPEPTRAARCRRSSSTCCATGSCRAPLGRRG